MTPLLLSLLSLCIVSRVVTDDENLSKYSNPIPTTNFTNFPNPIVPPWAILLNFQPTQHVQFILYTTANPDVSQYLHLGSLQLIRDSSFNASHGTRIIIHGWMGDPTNYLNLRLRNAYHNFGREALNVLVVDWSAASKNPNYLDVILMVPEIGRTVAEFTASLHTVTGHSFGQVGLVGHSLGAHIAGFAGKHVLQSNGVRLQTIVGLDPAGPGYNRNKPEHRLSADDAMYVQTIHTNAGQEGYVGPIGGAAFFPNWGSRQPGCGVDLSGACSHSRAVELFVESISLWLDGRRFMGVRCTNDYVDIEWKRCNASDYAQMGGDPLMAAQTLGVFYVETAARWPYALN